MIAADTVKSAINHCPLTSGRFSGRNESITEIVAQQSACNEEKTTATALGESQLFTIGIRNAWAKWQRNDDAVNIRWQVEQFYEQCRDNEVARLQQKDDRRGRKPVVGA